MSFNWSFSRLDSFETCAKKYYEYSVARSVKDDSTENLDWGNQVHDAMRDALRSKTPLPEIMKPYQHWVDRVIAGPGDLLVEQKYALDTNLSPCPYFAPVVWYRGIADAARIYGKVGLALDWKTGKKKDNSMQLGLMALCLFQHFAQLDVVRTEFIWLQSDETTPEVFYRKDMPKFVAELLPRVQKLEWAHNTMTFPPTPSGLCVRYCKVASCPYFGKGNKP